MELVPTLRAAPDGALHHIVDRPCKEFMATGVRPGSNSAVRRYAGLVREASESGHLETGGQCRRSATILLSETKRRLPSTRKCTRGSRRSLRSIPPDLQPLRPTRFLSDRLHCAAAEAPPPSPSATGPTLELGSRRLKQRCQAARTNPPLNPKHAPLHRVSDTANSRPTHNCQRMAECVLPTRLRPSSRPGRFSKSESSRHTMMTAPGTHP